MFGNRSWRHRNLQSSLISRSMVRSLSNVRSHLESFECYTQLSHNFFQAMKQCASHGSASVAQKIHAQLIFTGLDCSIFLQNLLLDVYSKCGLIDDAHQVFRDIERPNVFSYNMMIVGLANFGKIGEAKYLFDEMRQRDFVSWNSLMSGYFRKRDFDETLKVFVLMVRNGGCVPDRTSFSCAMKACGALGYANLAVQLHGLAEKFDLGSDLSIDNSVLDMHIKCGALSYAEKVFLRMPCPSLFCFNSMIYGYSKTFSVAKALDIFNQMSQRDAVSWSTIISILSQHGYGFHALNMFVEMRNQGFRPNSKTYASVLSACASIYDLDWGVHLHARILRVEEDFDSYLSSGLIDMYAKCGYLEFAKQVFHSLEETSAVSWTSLIRGIAQHGFEEDALLYFKQMREVPVPVDEFTLSSLFGICSGPKYISIARQLHAFTIKTGINSSVIVRNALLTAYSKCSDIQEASYAFEMMPHKDIVSWTAMITVWAQAGEFEKAQACFDEMPEQNVVTWNSMISMYVQHGCWEHGLRLYAQMHREGIMPDEITFATSIRACANLAILVLGSQFIAHAEKLDLMEDRSVANSVLTMYSKCGHIEEAQRVFDSMRTKDLVSWNAIMAGYAQHGQGRTVIEIFERMLKLKYKPDSITFMTLLSGCSHSGLVTEGKLYFTSMTTDYGISPSCEHFVCMLDLLSRAGLLEEAKILIKELPFKPNADVWGAFLNGCRIHHNVKLTEFAVRNLLELETEESGGCILQSSVYSQSGKFEGVADVLKLIKRKGFRKTSGCSWIEVNHRVHVFNIDEMDHPEIKDVYHVLDDIGKKLEETGEPFPSSDWSSELSLHGHHCDL
ncbi:hypothetical protein K2173_027984 [Erythroxylum novogranatense]|uniref:Pentatricopeptide repeat-containing protein At2g13600-like n=1 Tax=Erythroxylum novogranatense TaxID=1862640 RepID=A0AAV8U0H5_9ROSI|nr:hypothetical protein K2173_027984 [Erythroxylum novogranatense]